MSIARSSFVIMLMFLGAVFAISANATVWANRTVFNTDNFVDTVNRTLDDQEVQQQLATRLSTTLIEQGQVQERLRDRLPEGLEFLAPILTRTAQDLVYDVCLRLLQSDAVRSGLDSALRLLHQQVMKIIEDEGAVVVQNGQIILDLGVILREAADELNIDANGLLANLDLPDDAGQIVLVENAKTAASVQELLSLHDQITWLVIGLAVVMFALAVLIAKDRRATLRTAGVVLVVCGLLAVTLLIPLRPIAASLAQNPDAARAAMDAFLYDYRLQSFFLIFLGGGVIVVAFMLGHGELATAVKGTVRRQPGAEAPDLGKAIRGSATPLRVLGLVAGALVIAAWPEPTTRVYITTFALLALYFLGLWIITSDSEWAGRAREQTARAWGRVGGSPDDLRNATMIGRHANQLRIVGIVIAVVAVVVLPSPGLGAIAGVIALTFVYLALIDWLSTRQA